LHGAAGLELTQDELLTGTDGRGSEEIGRTGVIIPTGEQEDTEAIPGSTVRTTLNPDLQSIAQGAIDKVVAAEGALWGAVVAMEPDTGKVVVLADSDSVDPSDPAASSEDNRAARSVQAVFEPGSVG
ncbi:penicillin-binding protein 2, partial [Streptococcus danieliae]|nr:penicillin-binding protein 2 [Streptococcus danieliae]